MTISGFQHFRQSNHLVFCFQKKFGRLGIYRGVVPASDSAVLFCFRLRGGPETLGSSFPWALLSGAGLERRLSQSISCVVEDADLSSHSSLHLGGRFGQSVDSKSPFKEGHGYCG